MKAHHNYSNIITCQFFSLHIANEGYNLLFAFYPHPGASVTENPITCNALRNTGTRMNPMPIPINFLRPSIQVRFFSGAGTGGPKKPQGHPCRSLSKREHKASITSATCCRNISTESRDSRGGRPRRQTHLCIRNRHRISL